MVRDDMRFSDFSDFYVRRNAIKNLYDALSINEKVIYKYYVYSRRYISERICDTMWEFLNTMDGHEFVESAYILGKEYHRYR
jgi:hypothetical protein